MNNLEFWEKILEYCSNLMLVFQGITVLWAFKNKGNLESSAVIYIFYYCLLSFTLSLIEFILQKFILVREFIYFNEVYKFFTSLGISDFNFISPFSYLIKFIFLGMFFRNIFLLEKLKTTFHYLIYLMVIFELVMVLVFDTYRVYDSLSSTIKNIFLMIGSGLFLFRFYNNSRSTSTLQNNPYFWFGIAIFLPSITDFFLEFIFYKLYKTDLSSFYKYYNIRNISQSIGLLFLCIGFHLSKRIKLLPLKY